MSVRLLEMTCHCGWTITPPEAGRWGLTMSQAYEQHQRLAHPTHGPWLIAKTTVRRYGVPATAHRLGF